MPGSATQYTMHNTPRKSNNKFMYRVLEANFFFCFRKLKNREKESSAGGASSKSCSGTKSRNWDQIFEYCFFKKVWWQYATLFVYFSYFLTYIQSHSYNTLAEGSLHLLITCKLSGTDLPVVPNRESNSGLPSSKPTRYQLCHVLSSTAGKHTRQQQWTPWRRERGVHAARS